MERTFEKLAIIKAQTSTMRMFFLGVLAGFWIEIVTVMVQVTKELSQMLNGIDPRSFDRSLANDSLSMYRCSTADSPLPFNRPIPVSLN